MYNVLTREAYFALVDEARRHALPVTGHLPWRVTAAEASDAGQQIIDHLGSVYAGALLSCSAREDEIRKATLAALDRPDSTAMGMVAIQRAHLAQMLDSYDDMKAAALFHRFKKNGALGQNS